MKIIKMIPSRKTAERYYAEMEDGEKLTVNIAIIADYSLFSGRELEEDEMEQLKEASSLYMAKSKALKLMGTRPMSRYELESKLTDKGISPNGASSAADWMEELGAIDDREYAAMIVRHYQAKGYGIGRIKSEFIRRGINRELWDEALESLQSSEEKLDKLVRTRLQNQGTDRTEIKKLSDSLIRRGFTWEEVKTAIDRYLADIGEVN